jgi:hypothetical protein
MTHTASVTRQIELGQIFDVSQIILTSTRAGESHLI